MFYTFLNPAPAPLPEQIPEDIWGKIDYFTPNETELLKLTGQDILSMENVKKGAESLIQKGVKHVLVTLGDKGVFSMMERIRKYFRQER